MARLALLLLLSAALAPSLARRVPPAPARRCEREGRGTGVRRWLGCRSDAGPRRDLSGDERLLLGLPLELNAATARELSFVPGLTSSLAVAIVAERERAGRYSSADDLLRVHGIGPRRLSLARPSLVVAGPPVGVAPDGE